MGAADRDTNNLVADNVEPGSGVTTRIGANRISKRYGRVQANTDVSISVSPKQIHALVGENGAGKSTLMRALQGLEKVDSGDVIVDDKPVRFSSPQQAIAAGIGMVHQEFMLAPELTLLENLVLGDEPTHRSFGFLPTVDWKAALQQARKIEQSAGVSIDWHRRTETTPVHIQQYVEIFRLLRRGSDVLILDEPTAVLAPQQAEQLFTLLRELRAKGASIIFISHKLQEVEALADHVTIMRKGEIVASASIDELDAAQITRYIMGNNAKVARSSSIGSSNGQTTKGSAENSLVKIVRLNARTANAQQPLSDISIDVRAGEIVGVAGVASNGQEELVECLVGMRKAQTGSITIGEADLFNADNASFRSNGLGFVSPDRAREALAKSASIVANVMAGSQREPAFRLGPLLKLSSFRKEAQRRLHNLDVRYGTIDDSVSSLSGGNQQKLVFARETARHPKLLVVSQPTRGVDLNGVETIHAFLREHRAAGGSVILASEELDELMALCDRILVMCKGRIVGEVQRDDFSPLAIGELMLTDPTAQETAHG